MLRVGYAAVEDAAAIVSGLDYEDHGRLLGGSGTHLLAAGSGFLGLCGRRRVRS